MDNPALIDETRCIGCTQCKLTCPARAIEQIGDRCRVEPAGCTRCGRCIWVCPLGCIADLHPIEQRL